MTQDTTMLELVVNLLRGSLEGEAGGWREVR